MARKKAPKFLNGSKVIIAAAGGVEATVLHHEGDPATDGDPAQTLKAGADNARQLFPDRGPAGDSWYQVQYLTPSRREVETWFPESALELAP